MFKQNIIEDNMSLMSSQKLAVKLIFANITKRVRDAPETFEALKQQVKAQMGKVNGQAAQVIQQGKFTVTYEDDAGDVIDVSDDEDLMAAYDVAENFMNRQLKLKINVNQEAAEDQPMEAQIDSKASAKVEEEKMPAKPEYPDLEKMNFDDTNSLNPQSVRDTIASVMANKDMPESESDDSEQDEETTQKHNGKGKKGGKKNQVGGIPRKQFKKLIKKELDKQCQEIFNNMMNCPDIGGESNDQINSGPQVVHHNVICDGCGMNPIVGPRYKCTVRKNFDYCSMCEERKAHPHAFLKINKPEQVPKAMFTVIDESVPTAKADIEQDVSENNQYPTFFRNMCKNMMKNFGDGSEFAKQFGGQTQGRGCGRRGGPWGPSFMNPCHTKWGGPQGCQAWKMKKAQVVKYGQYLYVGKPGEIVMAEVEIRNEMKWAWKEGASLQSDFDEATSQMLDVVVLPINFTVPAQSTFKLTIPIKIREGAHPVDFVYPAKFGFHGRKGKPFGEKIEVKIRIQRSISEVEVYQNAMELFEEQPATNRLDFPEIVAILKAMDNDKEKFRAQMAMRNVVQAPDNEMQI